MCYTTQQLQAMTNFEIGQALAIKCGKVIADEQYFHYGDRDENVVLLFPAGESFNINNPNDIMPLAFERGISLIKVIDGYVAIKYDLYIDIVSHEDIQGICADGPQFGDTNPLRAIACLILMMDE